ncbi:MAG: AAA family ATPase, partial [Muribaculaceae bacterium]|nr:AAA family ATPase [Muribaculaceae bacterium]
FRPFVSDDGEFSTARLRSRMKYSGEFIRLLKQIELIIIDEISMVRADIIDFIDRILRVFCHNAREPFAGKQMLLVGDVFQLEPVVTGDMKDILAREYSNPFFFSAKIFSQFDLIPIELRKVYRQSDTGFVQMLDRIRNGHPLQSDIETLNRRVNPAVLDGRQNDDGLVMTIATRKDTVDSINESRLSDLKSKEFVYEGEISGDFPEASYPTDLRLRLKTGAQVVFIKNDAERRWVNGTLGKVVET